MKVNISETELCTYSQNLEYGPLSEYNSPTLQLLSKIKKYNEFNHILKFILESFKLSN